MCPKVKKVLKVSKQKEQIQYSTKQELQKSFACLIGL